MIKLYLLGAPRLERAGESVAMSRRKAMALLAYLALTAKTHLRDSLATLLWPDSGQSLSRANLRHTLVVLKQALGDDILEIEWDRVSPKPGIESGIEPGQTLWVDVLHFQSLLASCRTHGHAPDKLVADGVCAECLPLLLEAVALPAEHFMQGFSLTDSPDFDDWQASQQQQLSQALSDALEQLVGYFTHTGDFKAAIEVAQRRLRLDTLDEGAHRQLMRLYGWSGQQGMALRQFEQCSAILEKELDVLPSTETQRLMQQIQAGKLDAPAAPSSVTPVAATKSEAEPARPPQPNQPQAKLPRALTSFVGRERELAQLDEWLADPMVRLITVVGQGGMGKSRLVVEAANRVAGRFADGACFVALAPVARPSLLPDAVAAALEIPAQDATDFETRVPGYLSNKELLLILDNLEHLLDGKPFVERILEAAPGIKILATSRVRLRLEAEWLLPLEGLTITPTEHAAVDLFVQRARRVQPDFALASTLTPEVSVEISRICHLVGGMPLAIELAAAWLRSVPLAEIADEIQANLDFLAASMRSDSERHRSMRAVFEHSWSLLEKSERRTLMQLSVFRGGFTRQAATEVTGADLRLLTALIDSSWLQLNPQNRYDMHELARQFAEEKLDSAELDKAQLDSESSLATQARQAHCAHYAAFASQIGDPDGLLSTHSKNMKRLLLEIDNTWAGWRWAATRRDFGMIEKYVTALRWLADTQSLYSEVLAEFERVCAIAREIIAEETLAPASTLTATPPTATPPTAFVRQTMLVLSQLLTDLCFLYGRTVSVEKGLERGAESLQWLQQLGANEDNSEFLPAYLGSLEFMGLTASKSADYPRARWYCEEAIRLTQGKKEYLAHYCYGVNALSQVAHLQGNFAEAESLLKIIIAQTPDDVISIVGRDRLTNVYVAMGDLPRAAHYAAAAMTAAQESGNRQSLASTLLAQTEVSIEQGHFAQADHDLARVSSMAEELGNPYIRVRFLNGKARLARRLGQPLEAQRFSEQAYELATKMTRKKDAVLAQVGVGFALLDQGKSEDAAGYLRDGLQAAWAHRIMPEVIWAVVGLAALKADEERGGAEQAGVAVRWLQIAAAHPSCPYRVRVEAEEIRKRLQSDAQGPQAQLPPDLDAALEQIVLELLA